jgi:amino acid transporter
MTSASVPAEVAKKPEELRRVIGLWDSVALVVGLIIGSGIFRAPASVAQELPTPFLMLGAWVIGGLLSLAGGLAAAELGVRYPRSGGQYIFLREAFGPSVSFAFGWSNVLISKPSVLAGIATVFATYLYPLLGLPPGSQKFLAMGAVALFTFVNCLGVHSGTRTQNIFTTAKVIGLLALGVFALASGNGTMAHLTASGAGVVMKHPIAIALGLGLVTILYTYDGWIDVTYCGGEVIRPERTFPRAILLGTLACMGLYLLANVAYMYLLTPAEMAAHENIAGIALERAFGPTGNIVVSLLVVVSTLGILNGSILTGVRVPYAMAHDGLLPSAIGRVHSRTHSPVNALIIQGIFTCVIVLVASGFEQIASLFVSTTWFFYAVTFLGLLILQAREKRTGIPSGTGEGTYRMPFSPWPAVFFIVVVLFAISCDLFLGGPQVLIGLGVIAAIGAGHWLTKGLRRGQAPA